MAFDLNTPAEVAYNIRDRAHVAYRALQALTLTNNPGVRAQADAAVNAYLIATGGAGMASLDLNFLSGVLDPRITFTRASAGCYYNSAGVLAQAAVNAPRFEYDPVTKVPRGLLIEEQRTNLFLNSEGVRASAAVTAGVTDSAGPIPGFVNWLQFAATATLDTAYRNHTLTNGVTYTMSMLVKMDDSSVPNVNGNSSVGDFSLMANNAAYGGTVEHIGGGIYRVWVAFVSTAYPQSGVVRYGTQSGKGFCLTGMMIEQGAFPTSYIATYGAQATRAADLPGISTLSPWYNPTAGTMYAEFTHPAGNPESKGLFCFSDGTTPNRLLLVELGNGRGSVYAQTAGAGTIATSANSAANSAVNRIIGAYGSGVITVCVNGGATVSSNAGVPVVNQLAIGRTTAGSFEHLNGHLRGLRYIPSRLTDAELQALTV